MGPVNSRQTNEEQETLSINHPLFRDAQRITHKGSDYLKIKMVVDSERTVKKWEQSEKIIQKMNTEPLFLFVDYQFAQQGICGSAGIIEIVYENYPHILKEQLQNRSIVGQYFQQTQVWYLLYIVILAAMEFHKLQKKLGDIRPQNIFINKNGQVKIANSLTWPREENNYFKSLYDKQVTYLSPEEMEQLEQNHPICNTDLIKGQSFSIGLTLLEVVLLIDCSKLYNLKNNTFDKKQLQNLLGKLNAEKNYSSFLRQIIIQLLHLNPEIRKSPQQIYGKIKPYQYNIKNLINFKPTPTNQNKASIQTPIVTQFNDPRAYSFPNLIVTSNTVKTHQPNFYKSSFENKQSHSNNSVTTYPARVPNAYLNDNFSPVYPNSNSKLGNGLLTIPQNNYASFQLASNSATTITPLPISNHKYNLIPTQYPIYNPSNNPILKNETMAKISIKEQQNKTSIDSSNLNVSYKIDLPNTYSPANFNKPNSLDDHSLKHTNNPVQSSSFNTKAYPIINSLYEARNVTSIIPSEGKVSYQGEVDKPYQNYNKAFP